MTAILEVEHVTAGGQGLGALSDVSFAAERGTITAVVGTNGAGKSMLLDCITGFRPPPVGRIRMIRADGRAFLIERMDPPRIAREARIVRTFEVARPFAGMSVLENLLAAQCRSAPAAGAFGFRVRRRAQALEWLQTFALKQSADLPAGLLTYGEQRLLDIARAALAGPELLCLDEPATGLNDREIGVLEAALAEFKRIGLSILVAEHDTDFAFRISDRVIVLHRGAVVADGTPDAIRTHPALVAAYLGAPEQRLTPQRRA